MTNSSRLTDVAASVTVGHGARYRAPGGSVNADRADCVCGRPITRWRAACVEGVVVLLVTHEDAMCEVPLRDAEATIVLSRLGLLSPPSRTG